MGTKRIVSVSFAVAAASVGACLAQTPGLPVLNFPVGARAQAEGGACLAEVADPSAASANPARLVDVGSRSVFFYHSEFVSDLKYDYVSYAHPSPSSKNAFAIALGR